MAEHNLLDAVNMALRRAMSDDQRVLVLGQDVGIDGGVFRATDGLYQSFGAGRVLDTPLSETVIAGVAVGPRGGRVNEETLAAFRELGADQLIVPLFGRDRDSLARLADALAEQTLG